MLPAGDHSGNCRAKNRRQPEQPELRDVALRRQNSAGPVLRAGLTDALVTGIRKRWMSVRHSPMGIPANPTAAPFDVVPMITYRKKKVATTSISKHETRLYFPGLRSPKPLDANPPGTQPGLPDAIAYKTAAATIAPATCARI